MKSILEYIPQRPPFIMVDEIVHCDQVVTKTKFEIKSDCIFLDGNFLPAPGLIENIAQTCAARLGYLNDNQSVKIGMIGSIDNFELFESPQIGNILESEIKVTTEVLNVVVLSAEIFCENKIIAKCNMKVVLVE